MTWRALYTSPYPTPRLAPAASSSLSRNTEYGRGLPAVAAQPDFKAKFESGPSYFSFRRLVPGAVNVGFTGSACTSLPSAGPTRPPGTAAAAAGPARPPGRGLEAHDEAARAFVQVVAAQIEIESKRQTQFFEVLVSSAKTVDACNTGLETINLYRLPGGRSAAPRRRR